MDKICIIGAGRVGEATAQALLAHELAREIALYDVRASWAAGVALDLAHSAPVLYSDTRVQGSDDPAVLAGAQLAIITAGLPRAPGMSRSDVLAANVRVIDAITDQLLVQAPEALVLVVSNPVDVLTYRIATRTGWGQRRVFGQAGVLDGARLAAFIAAETGFAVRDITTWVLGSHSDTMVVLTRFCAINGIPVTQFIAADRLAALVERTRHGGAEILALRQSSSAYDAPGAAVALMVEALSRNRRRLLPCVALLEGEYGEREIALGVPCILDGRGLTQVVELELTADEWTAFRHSVATVRADLARLATL